MDVKYVVIKAEAWEKARWALGTRGPGNPLTPEDAAELMADLPLPEDSYFVVRAQDVFAPAGLYAYSANIQSGLEFLEATKAQGLSVDDRARLQELAHDIAMLADKWQANRMNIKVPD